MTNPKEPATDAGEVVEALSMLARDADLLDIPPRVAERLAQAVALIAALEGERDALLSSERETYHQNRAEAWQEEIADLHMQALDAAEARDLAEARCEALELALNELVGLARELVSPAGMVNRGVERGLVVVEKADKSDPHYRLCTYLSRIQAVVGTEGGAG